MASSFRSEIGPPSPSPPLTFWSHPEPPGRSPAEASWPIPLLGLSLLFSLFSTWQPEISFKIINQFTPLSCSKVFNGFLLRVYAGLHDLTPHLPSLPTPLLVTLQPLPGTFLQFPEWIQHVLITGALHSCLLCLENPSPRTFSGSPPFHSNIFVYLPSQRPSQALLKQ